MLTTLEVIAVAAALALVVNDFEAKQLLASLLFGVIVVIFAFDGGAVSRLLAGRGFGFLGKLSYSIYLTHAAVLFCVVSAFMVAKKVSGVDIAPVIDGTRYLDLGSVTLNNLVALLVVGSVVVVSMFTYRYVEMTGQSFGRALSNKTALSPLSSPDANLKKRHDNNARRPLATVTPEMGVAPSWCIFWCTLLPAHHRVPSTAAPAFKTLVRHYGSEIATFMPSYRSDLHR